MTLSTVAQGAPWMYVIPSDTTGLPLIVNANGPTTSTNSSPVVIATDQFPLGAALADATANPTISEVSAFNMLFNGTTWDRRRSSSVIAGTSISEQLAIEQTILGHVYCVSTQKITGFAGNGGFQFFNPSAGTKNILIFAISFGNAANVMVEMRKISADQSLLTGWTNSVLTPSNMGASVTASTATCGYSTTTVTGVFTGSYLKARTVNGNNEVDLLANNECIWLPSGAGSLAGICLTWAETVVGFNANVSYLEF